MSDPTTFSHNTISQDEREAIQFLKSLSCSNSRGNNECLVGAGLPIHRLPSNEQKLASWQVSPTSFTTLPGHSGPNMKSFSEESKHERHKREHYHCQKRKMALHGYATNTPKIDTARSTIKSILPLEHSSANICEANSSPCTNNLSSSREPFLVDCGIMKLTRHSDGYMEDNDYQEKNNLKGLSMFNNSQTCVVDHLTSKVDNNEALSVIDTSDVMLVSPSVKSSGSQTASAHSSADHLSHEHHEEEPIVNFMKSLQTKQPSGTASNVYTLNSSMASLPDLCRSKTTSATCYSSFQDLSLKSEESIEPQAYSSAVPYVKTPHTKLNKTKELYHATPPTRLRPVKAQDETPVATPVLTRAKSSFSNALVSPCGSRSAGKSSTRRKDSQSLLGRIFTRGKSPKSVTTEDIVKPEAVTFTPKSRQVVVGSAQHTPRKYKSTEDLLDAYSTLIASFECLEKTVEPPPRLKASQSLYIEL